MRVKSINPWGVKLDPHRSDLWKISLGAVIREFENDGSSYGGLLETSEFYASSVILPEQVVNAEVYRRESRPYNMPGPDGPLGVIRVTFVHDSSVKQNNDVRLSYLWRVLAAWRSRVRAGRGAMSSENMPLLDAEFNPPAWRFDVPITFLQGYALFTGSGAQVNDLDLDSGTSQGAGLEVSAMYVLKNVWLSTLKLADLSYENPSIHKIEASFYAEDVISYDEINALPPGSVKSTLPSAVGGWPTNSSGNMYA